MPWICGTRSAATVIKNIAQVSRCGTGDGAASRCWCLWRGRHAWRARWRCERRRARRCMSDCASPSGYSMRHRSLTDTTTYHGTLENSCTIGLRILGQYFNKVLLYETYAYKYMKQGSQQISGVLDDKGSSPPMVVVSAFHFKSKTRKYINNNGYVGTTFSNNMESYYILK